MGGGLGRGTVEDGRSTCLTTVYFSVLVNDATVLFHFVTVANTRCKMLKVSVVQGRLELKWMRTGQPLLSTQPYACEDD